MSDITAAGVLVKADDTRRVLLLQRSEDNHSHAHGKWEVPGGRLDKSEDAFDAAKREWEEEVGLDLPKGKLAGSWTTENYECFVWVIKAEAKLDLSKRDHKANPDRDKGEFEPVAWWDPADLPGNPIIRVELQSADWALIGSAQKEYVTITDALQATDLATDHVAAFDLDGTISASPIQLGAIMRGLRSQGWRVAILTGTGDGISFDHAGLVAKESKLRSFGVGDAYDELVLFDGDAAQVADQKAEWCRNHGVELTVDNAKANARAMTKAGVVCCLVPWATRT